MGEDSGNHRRIFDSGDDLQATAAVRAVFNGDIEDPFEQPGREPEFLADEWLREEFEERAAIFEYEGGLARNEAEYAAKTLLSMHSSLERGSDD